MFRTGTELVLVNVVVRDKNGAVVRGLTRDDFTVAEDDKPQTDHQLRLRGARSKPTPRSPTREPAAQAIAAAEAGATPRARDAPAPAPAAPAKVDMHGRRLIVLFFDLSSMQPEEVAARGHVGARLRRRRSCRRPI